jgi:protein involved in sex pheromone biosynthesis
MKSGQPAVGECSAVNSTEKCSDAAQQQEGKGESEDKTKMPQLSAAGNFYNTIIRNRLSAPRGNWLYRRVRVPALY